MLKSCRNIKRFYNDLVLPLVGCLRNHRLRLNLESIFDNVIKNDHFTDLNIDNENFLNFKNLFRGKRSLDIESHLNHDKILDLLNAFNENYVTSWTREEKLLLWHNALFWIGEQELSIRIASMEALELFLNQLSNKINNNTDDYEEELNFVRGTFVNQV